MQTTPPAHQPRLQFQTNNPTALCVSTEIAAVSVKRNVAVGGSDEGVPLLCFALVTLVDIRVLWWSLPAIKFPQWRKLELLTVDLLHYIKVLHSFCTQANKRAKNHVYIEADFLRGINSSKCCSLFLLLFCLLSSLFFIELVKDRSEETLPDSLPIGLQMFWERFALFQGEGAGRPWQQGGL